MIVISDLHIGAVRSAGTSPASSNQEPPAEDGDGQAYRVMGAD